MNLKKLLIKLLTKLNSFFVSIFKFLIFFYQKTISKYISPRCRFYPSCSSYAIQALEKKGLIKGFFLAVTRVIRCNPFSSGGYDPLK
jgi:uncharacterized protein